MPIWVILATVGTIAATALLTFVLYRINAPMLAEHKRAGEREGGDPTFAAMARNDGNGAQDGGGDD